MVVTSNFAVIARFCVFNVTCNEVGGNTTPDLVGGYHSTGMAALHPQDKA